MISCDLRFDSSCDSCYVVEREKAWKGRLACGSEREQSNKK
jgi:hypothetical protein